MIIIDRLSVDLVYKILKKYRLLILGIFFALLICFNALVYYQYVFLTMRAHPEPIIEKAVIDEENLSKVLGNLETRENNLMRVEKSQYADPFK